jgi:hypothetical protein
MITFPTEGSIDMPRELQLLAKEFDRQPATVLRTNLNLYQTPISTASAPFMKLVAANAKKEKAVSVTMVAIIKEPE